MIRKLLKSESGYSLVEVLVAIVILAAAILPMVGMFDAGLRAASSSGNYDRARALANQQLEKAKSQPYAAVKTSFPAASCGLDAGDTDGEDTCGSLPAPGFPSNFSYAVGKQYMVINPSSYQFERSSSATDTGLIRVTVTVTWGDGKTYSTTGLVAA